MSTATPAQLNPGKPLIRRFVFVAVALLVASTLLAAFLFGMNIGIWYCAGGITALIPETIFAYFMFRKSGARAAKSIVKGFYLGESLKIITTVVIFTGLFKWFTVKPLALLLGYIFIQIVHWLSPVILITNDKGNDTA